MKKTLLLAVVALSLSTVSCKKERTCDCSITQTTTSVSGSFSNTSTSAYSVKYTSEKQTKKYFRVDKGCYSYKETDVHTQGNTTNTTITDGNCKLK